MDNLLGMLICFLSDSRGVCVQDRGQDQMKLEGGVVEEVSFSGKGQIFKEDPLC